MHTISQTLLRELMTGGQPPCVSLYQPTHRSFPDNKQDPIRFKNLARQAEESLRRDYSTRELRPLLERFEALAGDEAFWNHTVDGLGVLADANRFEILQLLRPVPEAAIVADSFHVKPLLRYVQSADRYGVLCLTRESARLYEGNRDHLDPVDLSDFADSAAAALGERKEPSVTARSGGQFHGHDSRKDLVDQDAEKFFRIVDRDVREKFSAPSKLPLVLVALTEHQPVFREISHNEFLLAEGVQQDPQSLDNDALRRAVWSAIEPRYLARLAGLLEDFGTAQAQQRGSADVSDVARAAAASRVGVLLVDAYRLVPGKLDRATGAIEKQPSLCDPEVGDLIDDVAEQVLLTGGEVVVVPSDRMPTDSGLAATYRF